MSRKQTYRHYLTDAEAADFRPYLGGTVSFPVGQHSDPQYFRIKADGEDRIYLLGLPRVPSLVKVAQIDQAGNARVFRTPFRLVTAQKVVLALAAIWTLAMLYVEYSSMYVLQSYGYGLVALPLPWLAFTLQFAWYWYWDLDPERATKVANAYFAATAAVRIYRAVKGPQSHGSGQPDTNGRRNPLEYY